MLIEMDKETGQDSARNVHARSLRCSPMTCGKGTLALATQDPCHCRDWNHRETGSQRNKIGLIHALALAFLWMDF